MGSEEADSIQRGSAEIESTGPREKVPLADPTVSQHLPLAVGSRFLGGVLLQAVESRADESRQPNI